MNAKYAARTAARLVDAGVTGFNVPFEPTTHDDSLRGMIDEALTHLSRAELR
jgi:hypothetical protein